MQSGSSSDLLGVWGSSAGDVYAVGFGEDKLLHYDGVSWSAVDIISLCEAEWLSALWGTSGSNVYAVGQRGTVLKVRL